MARFTAPSMWLPGFDPEPVDTTESSVSIPEVHPLVNDVSVAADVEFAETVLSDSQRATWRVTGIDTASAPRPQWPALRQADLENLSGAATKFDSNLAAIATLRHVECQDRPPYAAERGRLLRFTGWGGLPAGFNPESDDKAWARRARQLRDLLSNDEYESARASDRKSVV